MLNCKARPCVSSGRAVLLSCFARTQPRSRHTFLYASSAAASLSRPRDFDCCGNGVQRSSAQALGLRIAAPDWGSEKRTLGRLGPGFSHTLCSSHGAGRKPERSLRDAAEGAEQQQQQQQQEEEEEILGENLLEQVAEGLDDVGSKPEICTADELHYVGVPGTNWRLALWRYLPAPDAPKRNHPLLMLSGIGTNALGFDLHPSVSMARYMAETGFDTWILEVRGSGLSKSEMELEDEEKTAEDVGDGVKIEIEDSKSGNGSAVEHTEKPRNVSSEMDDETGLGSDSSGEERTVAESQEVMEASLKAARGGASWEAWSTATRISNTILKLSNKLTRLLSSGEAKTLSARLIERMSSLIEYNLQSGRVNELREWLASLIEARENGALIPSQVAELRKRLEKLLEDGQVAVSPTVSDLQGRLSSTVDEFQKIVDLIAKYDWDFDNYLYEDFPTAMEYVQSKTNPVDGKVLSVGHSMGGIVLYAHLSASGANSGLAAVVSLASALDYQVSDSSLKMLLPLAEPAQVMNVPVVPLGALMTAIQPLVTRSPYPLAWVGYNISAQNVMETELLSKLMLNNFGTVPVKLLLHLTSVFQPGGLQNRDGTIKYKENIGNVDVPVLAVAADKDLICPPVAVLDTAKEFPEEKVTYKMFGGPNGRHFGHYDIVCTQAAKEEVFPYLRDFLVEHDGVKESNLDKVEGLAK